MMQIAFYEDDFYGICLYSSIRYTLAGSNRRV